MDSVVRYWDSSQGFPQVLRTWREGGGGSSKFDEGGGFIFKWGVRGAPWGMF